MADNKIQLKQIDQELTTFVNSLVNQNFTGFINAFINSGYFGTTVVYASGGNQSIFGLKTFVTSPQVPYSGGSDQAISMQFLLDRLSGSLGNVVYTTGNQIISSVKYFSDLTCAFPTGNPSAVNLGYFNSRGVIFNTGDQAITGVKSFADRIDGSSVPTGSTQFIRYLELTNASGVLAAISDPSTISGFLQTQIFQTGSNLHTRLQTTGSTLNSRINLASGVLRTGINIASGLLRTGINTSSGLLRTGINILSGIVTSGLPAGGISGQVLTKFSSVDYDTLWQTPTVGGGGGGGAGSGNLSYDAINFANLSYTGDADANGLFYWLGTNYGSGTWVNPYTAGRLGIYGTDNGGGDDKASIVDRADSAYSTTATSNTIIFDLKGDSRLVPTYYSYRYRNDTSTFCPSGWQIRGSVDSGIWTVLDNVVDVTPLASQWVSRPINSTTGYRYFEFLMSGANNSATYFTSIGEFELYGDFSRFRKDIDRIAILESESYVKAGPMMLYGASGLSFPSTDPGQSSDLIMQVKGAAINDVVTLGFHPSAAISNSHYNAWVADNHKINVRFNNYWTGAAQTPTGTLFSANVLKNVIPTGSYASLQFTGSAYVSLPTSTFNPDSDFTIEMWVKLNSNVFQPLFSAWTDDNNYWIFMEYGTASSNPERGLCFQEAVNNATSTFICAGGTGVSSTDGWTHVAVTRYGNFWTIYKNGSVLKTDTVGQFGISRANQQIATFKSATLTYDGYMDEVRVWNTARTETEINDNRYKVLTGGEDNLLGYWRFEETDGTTADDLSIYENDGTLVSGPIHSLDTPSFPILSPVNDIPNLKLWLKADALILNDNDPVSSWTDYSNTSNHATQSNASFKPVFKTNIINGLPIVRFDGTDDRLTFPNNIVNGSIFVVAAINVAAASISSYAPFVITDGSSFRLVAKTNTTNWGTFLDTIATLNAGEDLGANQFNIIEMTTTAGATSLYRNRILVASSPNHSLGGATGDNLIGAELPTVFLNADIAEVIIYNTVLSDDDRKRVENYLAHKYNL